LNAKGLQLKIGLSKFVIKTVRKVWKQ